MREEMNHQQEHKATLDRAKPDDGTPSIEQEAARSTIDLTDLPNQVLDLVLVKLTKFRDVGSFASSCRSLQRRARVAPLHLDLSRDQEAFERFLLLAQSQCWVGVHTIDLTGLAVEDAHLQSMFAAGCMPNLTVLILSRCHRLSSEGVARAMASAPSLRALCMQRCFTVTAAAATQHLLLHDLALGGTPAQTPELSCLLLSHFLDPIDEELRMAAETRQIEPPTQPPTSTPRTAPPDSTLATRLTLRFETLAAAPHLRVLALHNCHLAAPDASLLVRSLGKLCPGLTVLLLGGSLTSTPPAGTKAVAALTELAAAHLPKLLVLEATMHNFQAGYQTGRRAGNQAAASVAEYEIQRRKSSAAYTHVVFWDMCEPACVMETVQIVLEERGPTSGSSMEHCKQASIAKLLATVGQETAMLKAAARAAVNCSGPGRFTPLHLAAESGDAATCCRLLKLGADVDARDSRGTTPLFLAAEAGHAQVATTLLGGGAQVMAQNNGGENALYIAALKGHMELIRVLVVHCKISNIDWQDPAAYGDGWTASMAAAVAKRCDVARFLIRASFASSASPLSAHQLQCIGRPGLPPCSNIQGAAVPNRPLPGPDSARELDGEGARTGPRDGATASLRSVAPIPKHLLVGSWAQPRWTGSLNPAAMPFCMPVEPHAKPPLDHVPASTLRIHPARPSPLVAAANRFGQTTLHIVARRGFMPLLQMLLQAGASVTARDSYGFTAEDVARKAGKEEAMVLLQNAAEQAQEPPKESSETCFVSKMGVVVEMDQAPSTLAGGVEKAIRHREDVVEVAPGCQLTRRRARGRKGRRHRSATVTDGE